MSTNKTDGLTIGQRIKLVDHPNNHKDLRASLEALAGIQTLVSTLTDPEFFDSERPSTEMVSSIGFALCEEVHEFCRELGWKPWKEQPEIDNYRIADEFADILAFLGIFIRFLTNMGISAEELAEAYIGKSLVNIDRFSGETEEEGYIDFTKHNEFGQVDGTVIPEDVRLGLEEEFLGEEK